MFTQVSMSFPINHFRFAKRYLQALVHVTSSEPSSLIGTSPIIPFPNLTKTIIIISYLKGR